MPASSAIVMSDASKDVVPDNPSYPTPPLPTVHPTFPAYSTAASINTDPSAAAAAVPSAPAIVRKIEFAASSTSKLIHPDDDISLVIK